INHIDEDILRCRPITVSIESKAIDGEVNGRTQLGIRGAAHIMKLKAARLGQPDGNPLALPLLLVVGSQWKVYFMIDRGDHLDMILAIETDNTSSLPGCYKILALVRELGRWSLEVYRPWF
ncbi:hypothetical protein CONLIGDRAFT_554125, partial [Coniochaeta ligniaria NRRL 30616]